MTTITTRAPTNATPVSFASDQTPKTPDTKVTRGRSKSLASPEKLAGLKRSVSAGGARPNITASAGSGSRPRRVPTGSAAVPGPAEMKRIAPQFHQEFNRLVATHPAEFEFLRAGTPPRPGTSAHDVIGALTAASHPADTAVGASPSGPAASVESTRAHGSVQTAQADVYVSQNVDMTNEESLLEAETRSLHEVTSGVADPDPRHRPSRDSLLSGDVQV
ncbi:hypothetical protein PQQ51_01755 [Paraburkholderia xenovorans]|uniref:hypothetical protein n=1 Tax=Paraburkholderia xenovorans TaxID=36873 RepID=UPI0038B76B1B